MIQSGASSLFSLLGAVVGLWLFLVLVLSFQFSALHGLITVSLLHHGLLRVPASMYFHGLLLFSESLFNHGLVLLAGARLHQGLA